MIPTPGNTDCHPPTINIQKQISMQHRQFGGSGRIAEQRSFRKFTGIRSKPVLGDHGLMRGGNGIIEESLEDLNDDENECARRNYEKFRDAHDPQYRKKSKLDKNKIEHGEQSIHKDDSDMEHDHKDDNSIDQENLSVSY